MYSFHVIIGVWSRGCFWFYRLQEFFKLRLESCDLQPEQKQCSLPIFTSLSLFKFKNHQFLLTHWTPFSFDFYGKFSFFSLLNFCDCYSNSLKPFSLISVSFIFIWSLDKNRKFIFSYYLYKNIYWWDIIVTLNYTYKYIHIATYLNIHIYAHTCTHIPHIFIERYLDILH